MEYAIYPFKDMRITQRHDEGNHLPHWKPQKKVDCSDKPWDEACTDGGRQYFEPQNDWRIVEIGGVGSSITNYVRLETVNKVKIPYQEEPIILEMTLTHIDDTELKKYKKGQILKAYGKYLKEGKEGATAYHYHCTANKGKYYGLKENSNKKWCFVYDKSLLPNEAFYINDSIKIINANGYVFKKVPNELQYRVYVIGSGWTNWISSGIAGTTGKNKAISAIQIKSDEEIKAQAHFSYVGWVDFGIVNNERVIQKDNQKIECLQLKGDFSYRVHISYFGWTNTTNADGICTLGSVGNGWGIEAIEIIK